MTQDIRASTPILAALLLQLMGLTFAVLIDPYIKKQHRRILLINVAVILSLIVQNYVGYLLDLKGTMPYPRTIVGIYGYCMRPVVIVLYFYLVSEKRDFRAFWLLLGLNAAIHMTALFSGICFSIDADNVFHRGPLGYSCHVTSLIALVYLIILTYRDFKRDRKLGNWIPILNAVLIVAAVVLDSFVDYRLYPVSFMMIAVVSGSLFYYIWLHLQFVWEHEQALLAEQRIQIMMSQIQPHFLYNTLATIQALCRIDPEKAREVTEKFGVYLRQNLDSLRQPNLIRVQKELEHTRIYAEIEQIRFPNIRVEYEIEDTDFSLPALTIQPLVENAIRHGVRARDEGIVTVSTRKLESRHEIVIRDNGKGFDPNAIAPSEGTHIGIRNVRDRIEEMCGGTVLVESVIDEGTTVTIHIPS